MSTSTVKLAAPTAAVATAIAASQTPTLTVTLNGTLVTAGVATLDMPRRVFLQSAGNDSTLTWTVTGTDRYANVITETLAGGNVATVNTAQDFKTVTTIGLSGTAAGTVTIGTGAIVSSAWVPANRIDRQYNAALFADGITGKLTVERVVTFYDPALYQASFGQGSVMPTPSVAPVANMTTITASTAIADTVPTWAYRLTSVTLPTSTATLTVTQGEL